MGGGSGGRTEAGLEGMVHRPPVMVKSIGIIKHIQLWAGKTARLLKATAHNQNVQSLVPSIQVQSHRNVQKSKTVLNLKSTNTHLVPTVCQHTLGLLKPPWQHYRNHCCLPRIFRCSMTVTGAVYCAPSMLVAFPA